MGTEAARADVCTTDGIQLEDDGVTCQACRTHEALVTPLCLAQLQLRRFVDDHARCRTAR